MAIKFVEIESEPAPAPKKAPAPETPAEVVQPDPPGGKAEGQLPFAKSEPKPRGRKKPLK